MKDIAMHILDILQNSVTAGAENISVTIDEDIKGNKLTVIVEDDGKGMDSEQVERVTDPFFTSRTTRKVGLGIPLFKQSAIQSGGTFFIDSFPGRGTAITAQFVYDNIDRLPLGDIANVFVLTLSSNPSIEFRLKYIYNGSVYMFDTGEVKEVL
ncbi:MAG: ATP-binding protein, partial [Bacteroidales bacterium]|nr:ATP-binding protein [Bacteroidales bacterium]